MKILVQKFELMEGEELQSFIGKVMAAMPEGMFVKGIFSTYVISKEFESGRMFKMPFSRDADGAVSFGEGTEVKHAFVEISKDEELDQEYVEVEKSGTFWTGVL